jgi:hypothetical protein
VCFGRSPPPPRRAARRIARPAKTLVIGCPENALGNQRDCGMRLAAGLRGNENSLFERKFRFNKRPVGSEPMTNPRILTEPESTKLLDSLAPHWQLRLHDGAVIDHILKVINEPRPSKSHEARQSSPRFTGPLPSSGPSSGFGESSSDQVKKPA